MWIDDDDEDDVPVSPKVGKPIEPLKAPDTIYKAERPFLKIGLWFSGVFVTCCVALFAVGFIMGMSGLRPPSIDGNAIQNQWDKVTGQTQKPVDDTSELDKVEEQ